MKKSSIKSWFLSIFIIIFCIGTVTTESNAEEVDDFNFDDITFTMAADDDSFNKIGLVTKAPCISPFNTLQILNGAGIPNLMKFDLWEHTNPINYRNLLNYPTLMAPIECGKPLSLVVNPFFNRMAKSYFTKNSSNIKSYIGLFQNDDFLEEIGSVLEELNFPIPTGDLLSLLGNMTLQENRIGAMLNVASNLDHWYFAASMPIYYTEHNFFLSQKEVDRISDLFPFDGVGGKTPSVDWDTFKYQHLVADRIGTGDIQVQASYMWCRPDKSFIALGAEAQIPCAITFGKGLYGGNYSLTQELVPFNFELLADLACKASTGDKLSGVQAYELLLLYGTQVLDLLTANVADASLGQLHGDIGPVLQAQWYITPEWNCYFFGDLLYYIPGSETRLFKVKTDLAAFNRDYEDESQADANMAFLNQRANTILYPTPVEISVRRKISSELTLTFNYDKPHYGGGFGFDFWYAAKESFGKISTVYRNCGPLNIAAGTSPSAYQGRILGRIQGTIEEPDYTLNIKLMGDVAVFNKGIGKDFTINLGLVFEI